MNRDIFNVELNRFKNSNVRESTEAVLDMIPDYFYEIPASPSGKYHLAFSLGEGGLVRHVKVAMRVLEELFRDTAFGEYGDYTKDLIRIVEVGVVVYSDLSYDLLNKEQYLEYKRSNFAAIMSASIFYKEFKEDEDRWFHR